MLSPFLIFIRVVVFAALGNKLEKTVFNEYFHKFTYRYTAVESNSVLTVLRYYKYSVMLIFKREQFMLLNQTNLIYDSYAKDKEERDEYLADLVSRKRSFLARDQLGGQLYGLERTIVFLLMSSLFVVIFPISIFSSDRAKIGLILLEITENAHLLKILRNSNVQNLYFFEAYNRDSIFLCYLLKRYSEIKISIIPSNNPITTFYPIIMADEIMFTAPYQLYEYEQLKSNWIGCISTFIWPPFGYEETIIKKKNQNSFQYELGFLSSASALRRNLNHHFWGDAPEERAELKLIDSLVKIVQEKGYSILIFLHPIEKRTDENLKFSLNYYRSLFGDNVEFADFSKASKESFHKAEICISGFSSSQLERLFGGFKTIFAPMGELDNYFPDEALEEITANSYEELENLIKYYLGKGDEEYFSIDGLKKYHWNWYLDKHPSLKLKFED